MEQAPIYPLRVLRGFGLCGAASQLVMCALQSNDGFELRREPHNKHDPHAVAAYSGNTKVCYVNAITAKELAPWMDGGWLYYAVVLGKVRDRPWLVADLIPVRDPLKALMARQKKVVKA